MRFCLLTWQHAFLLPPPGRLSACLLSRDELTEDHRRKVVLGCPSITHPGGFHYGKFLAEHTLNYVYVMCYSCLAPLILPVSE